METGTLRNRSAPNGSTNTFTDVAVAGTAGDANVYVVDDSGVVYTNVANGATGEWTTTTPGSGSNVDAIDLHGLRAGHLVDGNNAVFATTDGTTFERIGVEDGQVDY